MVAETLALNAHQTSFSICHPPSQPPLLIIFFSHFFLFPHCLYLSPPFLLFVFLNRLASLSFPKLQIGSYKYVPEPLRLGDLHGNQFNVKITELKHDNDSDCEETLEDIIQVSE